jgi:hypothetical protein
MMFLAEVVDCWTEVQAYRFRSEILLQNARLLLQQCKIRAHLTILTR